MTKGKPVGTAFAEIDLDTTKIEKGLKHTYDQLKTGTIKVEDAYKSLGIKSDQVYNMMRANAVSAVDFIKNKTLSSKEEIVRAEQAAANKIKQINEQQFGHQTSLLSKLKSNWIATTAAITAAIYTIGKVWSMVKAGAAFEEQKGILDNLAQKYGTTADSIVESMRTASKGLIANTDLTQTALSGLAKGLKPDQLINLAKAADLLGDSIGVSAKTALEDLTQALETGRTRGLKNYLGTALDLEAVFGDLTSKLTETEKAQAMYNLTMIAATQRQAQQTKEVSNAADEIERLETEWNNLKTTVDVACMKMAVSLANMFKTSWEEWKKGWANAKENVSTITDFFKTAKDFYFGGGETKKSSIPTATGATPLAPSAAGAINAESEAVKKATEQYQKEIEALKNLVKTRVDSNKASEEAARVREAAEKRIIEEIKKTEIEIVKLKEGESKAAEKSLEKEIEAYRNAGVKETEIARLTSVTREKIALDSAQKIAKLLDDFYNDLESDVASEQRATQQKIEEAIATSQANIIGLKQSTYEKSLVLLQKEIEDYRKKGATEEQIIRLSNLKMQEIQLEGASKTKKIWDGVVDNIASAFESGFMDLFKGGIKNAGDAWKQFCDNLVQSFLRAWSQMAVNSLLYGTIAGKPSSGGATGGLMGMVGNLLGMGGGGLGITSSMLSPMTVNAGVGSYSMLPGGLVGSGGGFLGSLFGGGGGGGFMGMLSSLLPMLGFQEGGWLKEPIIGKGLRSNRMYSFAENQPELVVPQKNLMQSGQNQKPLVINNNFQIATPNPDSFRKSKSQIATDFSRTMQMAKRYS